MMLVHPGRVSVKRIEVHTIHTHTAWLSKLRRERKWKKKDGVDHRVFVRYVRLLSSVDEVYQRLNLTSPPRSPLPSPLTRHISNLLSRHLLRCPSFPPHPQMPRDNQTYTWHTHTLSKYEPVMITQSSLPQPSSPTTPFSSSPKETILSQTIQPHPCPMHVHPVLYFSPTTIPSKIPPPQNPA